MPSADCGQVYPTRSAGKNTGKQRVVMVQFSETNRLFRGHPIGDSMCPKPDQQFIPTSAKGLGRRHHQQAFAC